MSSRGAVLRVQLAMHSAWNWLEAATGVAWGWDVQVAVDMRLEGAALCESCFACQKDGHASRMTGHRPLEWVYVIFGGVFVAHGAVVPMLVHGNHA